MEFIFFAQPEEKADDSYRQEEDDPRYPTAALVAIDLGLEVQKTRFEESMSKIKITNGINASARLGPLEDRERVK